MTMLAETKPRSTMNGAVPIVASALIAAAVAIRVFAVAPSDDVSLGEASLRREAWKKAGAIPVPLVVNPIDAAEALGLSDDDKQALIGAIRGGRIRLAWLDVFDSDAEDGDRISVASVGLSQTVMLAHAPVRVTVAVPADHTIQVTGIDQGRGGGVTVGVMFGGRPVKLPPLAVGESIQVKVQVP